MLKFLNHAKIMMKDYGIFAKALSDLIYRAVKVCAQYVHLIDECHTGYIICIRLTPYILRLRFYTTFCTENTYSSIKDTK